MSKKSGSKEVSLSETTLSDRELKFWVTRQVDRKHCWIVVARLGEIISHEGVSVVGGELTLTQDTLEYVYIAEIHEESLLAVVQDNLSYYIIRNKKTDKTGAGTVSSRIVVCKSFREALLGLNSTEQKRLNIRKVPASAFTEPQQKCLEGVIGIDFIGKSIEEQTNLWKKFVRQQTTDTMDLSGFLLISQEIMATAKPNKGVSKLIFYQNNKLTNFEWLSVVLPNLKTISIWYGNMLQNEHLATLPVSLQELELHHCYQLTGRCLLHLLIPKMSSLSKLVLDNPIMHCQENTFTTVITPAEWSTLRNPGLTLLMLNSDGLTPDFTYYILASCPMLQRFIVADLVVDKLFKQTISGYDKEEIIFQSFMNVNKGFKRSREVKFTDLLKDKFEANQFSESMLKIIGSKTSKLQNDVTQLEAARKASESLK